MTQVLCKTDLLTKLVPFKILRLRFKNPHEFSFFTSQLYYYGCNNDTIRFLYGN